MTPSQIRKGDRYLWAADAPTPVEVTVRRVARDGTWADIYCRAPGTSWTKRQRLPLSDGFTKVAPS